MKKDLPEDISERLNNIKGVELSYSKLCEALGISQKYGNSKPRQLSDLSLYCQLDRVENTTHYIVVDVYDDALIKELDGHDKYQAVFEAALYNEFVNNGSQPIYVSYMDMLNMFNEVNQNFKILCNEEKAKELGEEYKEFPVMSQATYKILKQWTKRRIDKMNARAIVLSRDCFRLYSHCDELTIKRNVDTDSEEEKICQAIYDRASREIMPSGWDGEWVSAERWNKFEARIRELTIETFDGAYDDLKRIVKLSPATQDYIKEQLDRIYLEQPDLKQINDESCRKIMETTQLDKYTMEQRRHFVNVSIKDHATSINEKAEDE